MRFAANERTLPRLHLVGTLAIVVLLTLMLGGAFSWRSAQDHRASLERVSHTVQAQQQARLQAELDSAIQFLNFTRNRTEDVLRQRLREQVDTAMQVAQSLYDRESTRHTPTEVKNIVKEALRQARFFDGRGYYFIDDMQGQFVLLPTAPKLEGKTNLNNQDDKGHFIMRGLIEAARKPQGEGFSRYRWYAPDTPSVMADKLAYVRHFAPFDWLIGTGDYTYFWEQAQQREVLERLRNLRFGKSGHIGVMDRTGRLLLSPANPAMEGRPYQELAPDQREAMAQLLQKGQQGGGLVTYLWPDSAGGNAIHKTAMVRLVEPWGWVMTASVQDNELNAALNTELAREGSQFTWLGLLWPLALALGLGVVASYGFSRWLGQLLTRYRLDQATQHQALLESEALFRAVFDNAAVGIAQISPSGRFMQINQQFCDLLGYTRDEVLAQNFTFQQITLPEDLPNDLAQVQRLMYGLANNYTLEKRYVRKDGQHLWVNLAVHLVRQEDDTPRYFISAVHDITERKRAEAATTLAASVFSDAREGIMITDVHGNIIDVNASFTRITGYTRGEALGNNPRMLSSGAQNDSYYEQMWQDIKAQGHWYGEIWNRRKNGEVYAEMQTISAVCDAHGAVQHYVALFSDITPIKEHEQQLERIAHFDALTGLPNRVLLADRLQQAMHTVQRRDQLLAVAYLDLDGFKRINDTHGHDVGDLVLGGVANRMKQTLREGDTLARIGGDEFVAVLVDLPDATACAPLLSRLLSAAAEPMDHDGVTLQVSASLGVTFYPQPGEIDADQLQRQADQAMYQAKLAGKNRYHVFDAEQDRNVRGHHESLEQIHHAIVNNELVLHYQPKVNMRSGQVVGAEALVRWQHPQRGLLSPLEFLPVIENHPLAVDLGEWVMHAALTQMQAWHADGLDLPVSVNVGARQLQQRDFVQRLTQILSAHPEVLPGQLELEVLETSALEDISGVSQVIAACARMGVRFALDDFGTGYSSLTYLKRLPVAQLKIDQSFVRDMLADPDDMAILQGVISLAQAFKREVIAEGVETVAHGTALLALGCELAQGYGVARPMPGSALRDWVEHWQPDAAWTQSLL